MKKIITLVCLLLVSATYAQLIAIDDVVVGRADNPAAASSTGNRIFLNDYFNGTAITFGTFGNFTITETVPDPSGFVTLNPLGFVTVGANTPQGIYYITYQICENANPTNCDTAVIEIRVFPSTISSGSGSSEMSISASSGNVNCGGDVCITDPFCLDLNTGTIPPLTLSADFQEIGESNSYMVNAIPFNPPFSFGDTATGTSLTTDDIWSGVINFAFDFEFFQQNYSNCVLSTNGAISFDTSNANTFHFWTPAAGALIPNNTDGALGDGNIFGAVHDMNPATSGALGTDYNITYSIKGEAPFRVFVFSFFNVSHFSSPCTPLKTSQMIMFYETTNVVETYIFQKPVCSSWAGGRAAIGIQNPAGTVGYAPPGRNTGVWDIPFTAPEAWQFVPNGTTITSFQWIAEDGTILGTDPTALVVTPSQTTTYVAQVTYTDALTGVEYIAFRPITVVVQPTPVVTVTASADVCDSGDAIFTITGSENDVVEYNINGGPTQTVTLDPTGIEVITLSGITTTQTINLISTDNLNSVCGGPVNLSATVTVNNTPVIDDPADITVCNEYILPALTTGGDYYTAPGGPGGTGTLLTAGSVITSTQTLYVYAETATTPNCAAENSFVVTIDSCSLAVSAAADTPTICSAAGLDVTLTATPSPALPIGTYSYSWTVQGDATVLGTNATLVLSPPPATTTTYEVTLTDSGLTPPNDVVTNTVTVTVNNTPIADAPTNVTACDSYTLPPLTSGNYFTATNGGGTQLNPGQVITTTQTIYVYAETATTPNCTDENSFVVTINDTPVLNPVSNVTACDSYTLPVLTAGAYYTASGGTGTQLNAGDTIATSQTIYVYAETGTLPNCSSELSFNVTINTTPLVDAPTDVTVCNEYTLPALTNGTYYTGPGGSGTVLNAGSIITSTQTIYVYVETGTVPNCFAENSFLVTVNTCTISVSAAADTPTICSTTGADVTLTATPTPATAFGNFSYSWTVQGNPTVLGTNPTLVLSPPPAVTITYEVTLVDDGLSAPFDTATSTITVVVNNTPVVNAPANVTVCDSYTLPALTSGNYFSGPNGTGSAYSAGDIITTTQTIYVYGETATTPNCTDENSFLVTVNDTPVVDAPANVTACDSYVLPALTAGAYYTAPGGTGTQLNAGNVITTSQTIYVYAETGTTPNCFAENSFDVTINTTPVVDAPLDVTICDSYTLPALTSGTYYTGPNGTGAILNAGEVITSSQTIYVYEETGTLPNCFDENSFIVTINVTPTVDTPANVSACDSYSLPALTVGDYYTGPGGTGTQLSAGTTITTTQTLYVYAETGSTPNCTDESSFVVTINNTPPVDAPLDVTECVSYALPALTNGTYYTGPNGTGTVLNAGEVITTTQTIYVYAENATDTSCSDENSFVVTINPLPTFVAPDPLFACDDNVPDGMTVMDLTTTVNQITGNNPNYVVTFHNSPADAIAGTPEVSPSASAYMGTDGEVISVRIEDATTGCFDITTLTLSVVSAPAANTPSDLHYCDPDNDGLGTFDLSGVAAEVTTDPSLEVTFHLTLQNAIDDVLPLGTTLSNLLGQIIYVRVDYAGVTTDCPTIVELQLIVDPTPVIEENPDPITLCDDAVADGLTEFDLTVRNLDILNGLNPADFTVTYYADPADADVGPTAPSYIATPGAFTNTIPNLHTVGVRVENNTTNCYTATTLDLIVNPLPVPETTPDALVLSICDDTIDNDGYAVFNLTVQDAIITGGNTNWSVSYFETAADIPANPIPDFTAYTNTSIGGLPHNPQTIFVLVTNGTTGCTNTSTLTLEVSNVPTPTPTANITPLAECDVDNDGYAIFDLQQATLEIDNGEGNNITYHGTYENAFDGVNQLPDMYENNDQNTDIVYVRAENPTTGCFTIVELTLIVQPTPEVPLAIDPYATCDDDYDGIASFDLTTMDATIYGTQNPADYVLTYHESLANAEATPGINPIVQPQLSNYVSANRTIYVRLEGANGCITVGQFDLIVNLPPTIASENGLFQICDDSINNDGFASFDLTTRDDIITGFDATLTVDYYETLADIAAGTPIPDYTNYTNTSINGLPHNPQTIFVTVTETSSGISCSAITTLTLVVNTLPTPNDNLSDLELCDDNNPGDLQELFDLTVNEPAMLNAFDETVTYHTTPADAESGNNPIPDPTAYQNTSSPQTIYARVTKTGDPANPADMGTGCHTVVTFNIIVNPLPATPDSLEDIIACDVPFDNVFTFDLTQRNLDVLGGQSATGFQVTYYTSLAAAEAGTGSIANPSAFTNTVNPQEIFVNIRNTTTGCDVVTQSFFVIVQEGATANPDNNPLEYALCDDNMEFDGNPTNDSVGFDLASQNANVLDGQNPANFTVSYYTSQTDADLAINAIDLSVPFENTVNPQVIYVRVDNDTTPEDICYDTTTMTLIVDPIPAFTLADSYTLCVNTNGSEVVSSPILDTNLDPSLYTFEWTEASNPTTIIGTDASYEATAGGTYSVLVTDVNNFCFSFLSTTVIVSSPPVLEANVTTLAFADNHVIEASASGDGSSVFEFSIDNGPWVSNSPNNNTYTFTNVSIGSHIIKARDINGCGETSVEVFVLDYPLFFTPNGDGDNDTWQIAGVEHLQNVKIYIYDRFGKLLKQLNPNGPGWDGTYNGEQMPTSDYWFTIDYQESAAEGMKQFKAHFTLKR
ncbi:T9SS type B sorting domain-containing protein [Bizionia sediminis]|uniref:T9SS type B sorting domain-containing protein n=1 Tax=Bizionia sediminis TaxID=1737064 RepID=A0ABW5KML0_9FLAO